MTYDAVIVGAGPNGLAAAITLARAGKSVVLYEANESIGGGCRSAELTLPGFTHDVCSAIHPLGLASPFFRALPLEQFGLAWIQPPAPLAHPLADGTAIVLDRSLAATGAQLGRDGAAYRRMMQPLVAHWQAMYDMLLGPLLTVPRHPLLLTCFGMAALWPARRFAQTIFREPRARAVFAGMTAHSMLPLERWFTTSFGLALGALAHAVGWPLARGGSQKIADALACYLRSLGGEIHTGTPIASLDELPCARAFLFDVTPRQLLQIAGERLPSQYRRQLERYRYGPGVFKMDWALDGPIPWAAAECSRAATVHVGGTIDEIAAGERAVWRGAHAAQPFVLLAQPSLFDDTRAPDGKHTAWAYCHVPSGSTRDMTAPIEAQIERFAPGFRARIIARSTRTAVAMEQYNANYIGGDINGGVQDVWQTFMRPALRLNPYTTPARDIFICSSATPPGGGVHGMCGHHAARAALRSVLRY
ncbi:MAG: NAD(P)/FAD-dependent oxidoreductase [Chloroflexota bacterium]